MFSIGTKFSLLLLFTLSLFLASQCYNNNKVPLLELQGCQVKCLEKDYNTTQEHICAVMCLDRYIQERAARENGQNPQVEDPRKVYQQCKRGCSDRYEGPRQGQQKQLCLQQCKDRYEEQKKGQEKEERGSEGEGSSEYGGEGKGNLLGKKKEEEEKHEKNPYFFEEQRFESRFRTEEGHFRVLQRFSDKSELLNGIDDYRLAIFEANPRTLFLPHHCDADTVFFVSKGQAIINIVHQNRRDSFNLRQGDAIKVPAGATLYIINHDNNEKLQILTFAHPINTPGHFEEFFGAGGENPQSFYRVFSKELIRAALNIKSERYEGFFEKQKGGAVIKLSQEQLRALSQQGQEGGSSSQGQGGESGSSSQEQEGESRGPFNLPQQQPKFANEFGQFFEASPDNNDQLRQLGFSVALMNIKQGAMIVPYHNTRSTIVVVAVGGKGEFELACPHLGRDSQDSIENKKEREKRSVQYQKISARFSEGDAFIIPADHPISIYASENENVQLVGFGVNARNNHKHFFAGKDNIWSQIPPEVTAISFKSQPREAEEVFGSQPNSYFVPGPKQSQQREEGSEKGHSVASILDFVGFI